MDDNHAESTPKEQTDPSDPTELSEEEKTWGMLAHLSGLAGLVGIPFGNILGPLVVWIVKKDEMSFVDREGKEALNFQISMAAYGFVVAILCFVLIGLLLAPILFFAYIILTILASVKAKEGTHYQYPFIFRLIT